MVALLIHFSKKNNIFFLSTFVLLFQKPLEKHKTYHIKDELLARDGFKKFMKSEPCSYDRCRFSLQCNHIHCVRENCFYVLHSSGQLLSHKRKHERQASEKAYQQYKITQKNDVLNNDSDDMDVDGMNLLSKRDAQFSSILASFANDNPSLELLQQLRFQEQSLLQQQPKPFAQKSSVSETLNSLDNNNYDPIDPAIARTIIENANASIDRVISTAEIEHLKQIYTAAENAKQKQITATLFAQNSFTGDDQIEPLNLHLKKEANDSLLSAVVHKTKQNQHSASILQQITSIDGLFSRKRGRPPKNRVVEVYGNVSKRLFKYCFRISLNFQLFLLLLIENYFSDRYKRKRGHRRFSPVLNWKKMANHRLINHHSKMNFS